MNTLRCIRLMLSALLITFHPLNAGGAFSKNREVLEIDEAETAEQTRQSTSLSLITLPHTIVSCICRATGVWFARDLAWEWALWADKPMLVKAFIQSNFMLPDSPVLNGDTPLLIASGENQQLIVHILLDALAEVNKSCAYGLTPLAAAIDDNNHAVVRMLLNAHADINHADFQGMTPLMRAYYRGHTAMVHLLLDAHADVNSHRFDQKTLLIDAIHNNDIGMVHSLIKHNVSVNDPVADGVTPLIYASQLSYRAIVNKLIEAHADLDAQEERYGNTALMYAAQIDSRPLIEILLQAGATVNSKNKDNISILEKLILLYADCKENSLKERIEILLHGSKTIDCSQALAVAREKGLTDIISLLEIYIDKHSEDLMVKPAVHQ